MPNEEIIITSDIDEVAKIHCNPKYINWKYEIVDGKYKFYPPNYQEDRYVSLDKLDSLFSERGFIFYGHGTGRNGNADEVVDSIFNKGLRTKDNSLYFTTIVLSTPTPEIKETNRELGIKEPTMEDLKNQLNNWQHLDSKKIIIARLPIEYINNNGDHADLDGEQFGAFYIQDIQPNGKVTYYLDPKFIVGCYDAEKQLVRMNKNFERTLNESTIKRLRDGYKEAIEKTKNRLSKRLLPFTINNR